MHSAYSLSPSESLETFLYPGLIEEIVEVLELPDQHLMVGQASCLTTPQNLSHHTPQNLTTQHLTTSHLTTSHSTTSHHTALTMCIVYVRTPLQFI